MSFTIQKLNHFAYRCRDAEETRAFYEDLLGLPLAHVIKQDYVPSTNEYCPYVHIFFRMADGSYIAFFDLGDGKATKPDPDTPAWVNHIALQLDSIDEVLAAKVRLEAAGIPIVGVTDHEIIQSIYFFDPNGLRVELTTWSATESEMAEKATEAHAQLAEWVDRPRNLMANTSA